MQCDLFSLHEIRANFIAITSDFQSAIDFYVRNSSFPMKLGGLGLTACLNDSIMNGVLGIMMLVAPETMPLDMLLMIGNSGFMTWYNQQTKNDPMAPGTYCVVARVAHRCTG